MPEQTLSLPSLLLLVLLLFLTARYLLSPSPPRPPRGGGPQRPDPAHVEQIASMFPHLARRHIAWDLQRNGGSVAATTERILGGAGLDVPPPTFQPPLPPSTNPQPQPRAPATSSSSSSSSAPAYPDLITRYNLGARLASPDAPANNTTAAATSAGSASGKLSAPGGQSAGTWATSRAERQALLTRRRDEMVLNARRRLEEEERGRGRGK